MTKYSLAEIKNIVESKAVIINAPAKSLPSYEYEIEDGKPFIQVDPSGFLCFVRYDRGREVERKSTDNIDDLLYWIFADITWGIAFDYMRKNRVKGKDHRRILFSKQEELLGNINENWQRKRIVEHQQILESSPFDDILILRNEYIEELKKQGHSESEILNIAYTKYPME